METIEIILKNGKWTVETKGFSGPACEAATKDLISSLGGATSSKKKSEYYEKPKTTKTKLTK